MVMYLNRRLVFWGGLLLLGVLSPATAHNGALAIAVPVEGIKVDGDLSDWPAGMRRYSIALPEYGDKPKGPEDFQGNFRIGYNTEENVLYVAVEVHDESVVKEAAGAANWDTQDGCEIYVDISHKAEDVPARQYAQYGNNLVADPVNRVGTLADVKVEVQWGERGYRYEWRIDVGQLSKGQAHLKPGTALAFDLALLDKDQDGSVSWMAWGPGIEKMRHSARLGDVFLVKSPADLGMVLGRVTIKGKVEPYADLIIHAYRGSQLMWDAQTDSEGRYQLEVLPGEYTLKSGRGMGIEPVEMKGVVVRAGEKTQADFSVVPAPILVRLSYWVPPARMAEFEAVYQEQLLPLMKRQGMVESSQRGRAVADSVFSRLFEGRSIAETRGKLVKLEGEPAFRELEKSIGKRFGTPWPDGFIQRELTTYAVPAASGGMGRRIEVREGRTFPFKPDRVVEARGRTVLAGTGVHKGFWHTLGVADGLASNTVYAMLQDRQGNLWFGTEAGACRYDGVHFTTFTTEDGLSSNWVNTILEDRQGNLWFGTGSLYEWFGAGSLYEFGGGVSRYDGHSFTTYTHLDSLPIPLVASILEDRHGDLWFGTGEGIARYRDHQLTLLTAAEGLPTDFLYGDQEIVEDHSGNIWIATNSTDPAQWKGVVRFDGTSFTVFDQDDGLPYRVGVLLPDRQGNLWFGSDGQGLGKYDGGRVVVYTAADGLAGNQVASFLEDRAGNLWFGTLKGVSRYDGKTFTTFMDKDGLAQNVVQSMVEDREGNLWFGTGWFGDGRGVSRYEGESFFYLTPGDSLGNQALAALEDRQGHWWVSTKNGVNRYDGKKWTAFTGADGLSRTPEVMLEDRQGNIWFGYGLWRGYVNGGGGLTRYDGKKFVTFTTADGLPADGVGALLEDHQGSLWIGTEGGLCRYAEGKFTTVSLLPDQTLHVRAILKDRQGKLWVGTYQGAGYYEGEKFTRFTSKEGLVNDRVYALCEDRQGNIWFGTESGVSRWDGKGFVNFTSADGLGGDKVVSILEDSTGHLLFGSPGGGVTQYDGLVFQSLLQRDGLIDNQVHQLLQDHQGDLWIATDGGLTRYRPHHTPPPVRMTEVVADHQYGPVVELSIPSSQDFLSFQFAGQSYKTAPNQLAYAYRLAGYDQAWRWTKSGHADYADLPVGEYTFEVKAVDRDLDYSETPAAVRLTVHPPYGIIALAGGLGLALVGLVIASGYGIKRRRERDRSREELVGEQQQRLLAQEQLNKELEEELQTAHTLQMDLMPRESPRIAGLDLAGRCIPANHVGGDLFQYFHQDGQLSIALADVTGHAMEAAIPMVMFSGVLRSQIEISGPIEELFGRLNRSLHNAAGSRTFVCFSFGTIDTRTSTLRLSSAAFPYPYHFSAATGEIAELRVDAYPLGVRPDTTYQAIERQLAPGDYLVFCSDGIIETTDGTGAQFGYARTAASLRNGCMAGLSAEALLEQVVAEVRVFRGETPQGDDQTVVVLKVAE